MLALGLELGAWIHFLGDALRLRWILLDHNEGVVVFDDGLEIVELMTTKHDEVADRASVRS
jgi:hypothetical protein